MQASTIQKILSSQDLEQTSRDLPLPLPNVKGVQLQWLRRLSGKCAVCGKISERHTVCQACHHRHRVSHVPSNTQMIRMLKQVGQDKPLIHRVCSNCGHDQVLTAGQVVQFYKKYGSRFFRGDWLCGPCFKEQHRKTQKAPQVQNQNRPLTFRPFSGLKMKNSGVVSE